MTPPNEITLTDGERRSYNLSAALAGLAGRSRAGFAWDVSDELRKSHPGEYRGGLLVPLFVPLFARDGVKGQRAGLDTATGGKGSELKFTGPGVTSFVDALRARTVILSGGATLLDDLQGDVAVPEITAGATAVWQAQNAGVDAAVSTLSTGSGALSPKTVLGTTAVSRQLLAVGARSVGVDRMIRYDLATVLGVALDAGGLAGAGGTQPTGIVQRVQAAAPGNVVAMGANGASPTYAQTTSFEKLAAIGNADEASAAYVVTPEVRDRLRITDRSGASGRFILDGAKLNDHAVMVTNGLPKNLTKGTGTNLHAMIYGAMADVIVGTWGAVEILADPFTSKKQAMVELTAIQFVDIQVRHASAFAVSVDVQP